MNFKNEEYILNITYEHYLNLANILKDSMEKTYGIPFHFVYSNSERFSATHYDKQTRQADSVQISIYRPNEPQKDSVLVSDYTTVFLLESFFHEEEHVYQSKYLAQQATDVGKDMALALIAFYGNDDFYINDHYDEIAIEMDAGIEGIKQAHDFMVVAPTFKKCHSETIDAVMTQFVNARMAKKSDYPFSYIHHHKQYNNWNDILNDINGNAEKNILPAYNRFQRTKKSGTTTYDTLWINPFSDDIIVPVLCQRPDILNMINNAQSIREECEIISSVTCTVLPNLKENFKALDDTDLSMKTICGTEFTSDDTEAVRKMKQRYDNIETDNLSIKSKKTERLYADICEESHENSDQEYDI